MIAINDIIIKRLRFLVNDSENIKVSSKKDIFAVIRLFNTNSNKYLNAYLVNLYCQLEDIEKIGDYKRSIPDKYYNSIVNWINKYSSM